MLVLTENFHWARHTGSCQSRKCTEVLHCAVFILVKLISGSDLSPFGLYNGKYGKILLKIHGTFKAQTNSSEGRRNFCLWSPWEQHGLALDERWTQLARAELGSRVDEILSRRSTPLKCITAELSPKYLTSYMQWFEIQVLLPLYVPIFADKHWCCISLCKSLLGLSLVDISLWFQ